MEFDMTVGTLSSIRSGALKKSNSITSPPNDQLTRRAGLSW